jgi:predicted transcriptional regulator
MTIQEVADLVEGKIVVAGDPSREVSLAFASDLMSDVLTLMEDNIMLITGLATVQAIRTALMSDIDTLLIVRGKRVTAEMVQIAETHELALIQSAYSMFRASGVLYSNGLKAVF